MAEKQNDLKFKLNKLTTPSGLEIAFLNKAETEYVYNEIFKDRVYFRHGIDLREGDVVFDVGANIGLFSMFVLESFPNARVFSFEPSPEIFAVLNSNLVRYGDRAMPYNCGLSNETKQATFTFYPRYSIISGFHAHEEVDMNIVRTGILNQWRERYPGEAEPEEAFLDSLVQKTLGDKQEQTCQLRSLSEILREAAIPEIALLKIDAEGCEMEVLSGIEDGDWKKIRQVAMEIHDTDGTLQAKVQKTLEDKSFKCTFEVESQLQETGIVNCYATRL